MFTSRFQVAYAGSMLLLFCVVAFFTRATPRRIAGALCSVAVFTALSAPIDTVGLRTGLWTYPSCIDPPHPPLLAYVGQALEFVGCIALVGWRVQRRFGRRGVAALAAVVCALGAVRDFSVAAALPQMMHMGPLPGSLIADVVAWGIVVSVALGVMRIVSGPAPSDPLR
ncbi:MAG TPA: hypothetical protein VMI75_38790 [Polyangiaceae bacterium]|nr:hypothetical protein [Polyangiaceae bacterium]